MSHSSRRIVLLLVLLLALPASAATPVPPPESVLGFELGERAVRHAEVVRCLEALAEVSPRAELVSHAETHEGSELDYLIVSSEANMTRLDDMLHLGGLLWPEAPGRLAHTAFLTREGRGRGQVILFAQDPNFRGYFDGTSRLSLNAVLLGPGLGTQQTVTW